MTTKRQIDLNCDLGEGYPHDAELMKYISSANIACGGHFGDADSMKRTIELALENNVAIGAHPSYPDRENFGRKSIKIEPRALMASMIEQIEALRTIARSCGTEITHIKPHGALYNDSAKDRDLAALIAETVAEYDRSLVIFGLADSFSIIEAESVGINACGEAFADRTYQADGSLTPRTELDAFVMDSRVALSNIVHLIDTKTLIATTGKHLYIHAETVCIHGDGPKAVEFASTLYMELTKNGVKIKPKYG